MFQSNHQLTVHTKALSIQDSSAFVHVGQSDSSVIARDEMQNGALFKAESIVYNSKKLQGELQMLDLKIKQHEDNIKFLKTQKNSLDESILDMQVSLGKYHSSMPVTQNEDLSHIQSDEEIVEHILRHEKSAAGILCQVKTRHGSQAYHLPLTKDVVGIVATLGKVDDDNLSREDVDARFQKSSAMPNLPENYFETEKRMKEMKWEKERLLEDMKREGAVLEQAKFNFQLKKQELSSSWQKAHHMRLS